MACGVGELVFTHSIDLWKEPCGPANLFSLSKHVWL